MILLLIFTSLIASPSVWSYSGGPPVEVCKTMTPKKDASGGHGADPQTSETTYTVTTQDKTSYAAGETIEVTLGGPNAFKGFMIQARNDADGKAVGTFVEPPEGTKVMECDSTPSSALSHSNANDKKDLKVKWKAPADGKLPVTFYATFVQEKAKFWVKVTSNTLSGSAENPAEEPTAEPDTTKAPQAEGGNPDDGSSGTTADSKGFTSEVSTILLAIGALISIVMALYQ